MGQTGKFLLRAGRLAVCVTAKHAAVPSALCQSASRTLSRTNCLSHPHQPFLVLAPLALQPCSVLQAFEGIMEVLGTAGDANLGGNDFDARLADWLEAECATHGVAAPDRGARFVHEGQPHGWALEAAEAAKVALSRADSAEVALPGGASLALSRQQFEQLTSELFQRMANVLEALGEALFIEWAVRPSDAVPGRPQGSASGSGSGSEASGSSQQQQQDRWAPPPRRITQVALVGQLTRLPSVQQFVARCTGGQGAGCRGDGGVR